MSLPTFSFLYSSRLGPILIGCIRVAIAVITPLVIRKISPKLLFMMSFFISAMAMTTLGFMAYLKEYYPTSNYWNYLSWVPITMIILAVMTRSAGKVIIYKSRKRAIFMEQNMRFWLILGLLAILKKLLRPVFFVFSLAKILFKKTL